MWSSTLLTNISQTRRATSYRPIRATFAIRDLHCIGILPKAGVMEQSGSTQPRSAFMVSVIIVHSVENLAGLRQGSMAKKWQSFLDTP